MFSRQVCSCDQGSSISHSCQPIINVIYFLSLEDKDGTRVTDGMRWINLYEPLLCAMISTIHFARLNPYKFLSLVCGSIPSQCLS